MNKHSRRDFLRSSSLGAGSSLLFGSATVSAEVEPGLETRAGSFGFTAFRHGVASGDPLQDRVIIWTRVTVSPKARWLRRVPVGWEAALDPEFRQVVRRGFTLTSRRRDFTVKIDLVGLKPGLDYYYRFNTLTAWSPIGCTRTLPMAGVEQVKLAVMSCSNYPAGYFNVYTDAAQLPDLDAVCHLGDYIYEYGPGGYADENADAIGRSYLAGNDFEIVDLQAYRDRYAQYRTDSGLQALHAHVPWICVWDDHEVANDAWKTGAENHNPELGEGEFADRKRAALRAYYEWMPVRPPDRNNREIIYRSFDFGDLVSLYMLDTRIVGRDQQLNYLNYIGGDGSFDAQRFGADISDPSRELLGSEQLQWLSSKLVGSPATWQVLGQQVLIGRMTVPAELLFELANPGAATFLALEELATLKARVLAGDPTVSDEDRARLETQLPYNLDAWDGYPVDRETIFATARAAGKNLVVLAGDTHNAWANDLKDLAGNAVGVEFATASVSSPGLEAVLGIPPELAPGAEGTLQLLIDDLRYTNVTDRGYLTVTFTRDAAIADWTYLDNILSTEYQQQPGRARRLQVRPGMNRIEEV
jgi:alkaline phosphatase D